MRSSTDCNSRERPLSIKSRNAAAHSPLKIAPKTSPYGPLGNATSGIRSQNSRRTPTDASKFLTTAGMDFAVAFLTIATFGRRPRTAGNGASRDVLSFGSCPLTIFNTASASRAERHIGPSLSEVHINAMAPCRLTRPYVGRRPLTPQNAAGTMMEPLVSEPIAKPTSPAATAAPGPLDEPPLQYARFHGVRPGPVNEASASLYPNPPASSTIASFAHRTAPASCSFFTTVPS